MDDDFFNHLGPFFQTTPRITIQEKEDSTEQPFLPKVVNSPEVTWSPPLVDHDAIYEGDYSYYFDNEIDGRTFNDYEWKPYQPTDQMVNREVDVLTAPFNGSTDANKFVIDCEIFPIYEVGTPTAHQKLGTRVHSKDKQRNGLPSQSSKS